MKTKYLYLLIAIIGTIVPYYHFSNFLFKNGLNPVIFFQKMTQNDIASFFSWDVIISSFAVITFIIIEGKKRKMKNLWVFIVFNLLVGVSLALPAFLFSRALKKEKLDNI